MQWRRPAASLRWRTLFLVVLTVSLVHLVFGAKIIADNRAGMQKEARQHVDLLTITSAAALSAPLWDFDIAQVANALAALELDRKVVSGWLNDGEGNRIARFGRGRSIPPYPLLTARQPIQIEHHGTIYRLGTLTVQVTTRPIELAMARQTRQTALLSAMALLAVCLSLLIIARTVIRPLAAISSAIAEVSAGRLHMPIPAIDRSDEIGEVARAVEGFRLNLIEMAQLRAQNDRLAGEERLRIRSALESTEDAALILNESGRVIFLNPTARALLPSLRIGEPANLIGLMPRQKAVTLMRAIRRRVAYQDEIEMDGPEGRPRLLGIRLNPIRDRAEGFFGTVILAADVTERARAERRIEHLANHDSLTGLPNRRVFERELAARLMRRAGPDTALFLLDLDRFKAINDMLGHPVGDRLLVRIGQILRGMLRGTDLVARLGGDEFALLISGRNLTERAEALAADVVRELGRPVEVAGRQLNTGVSVGYLIAKPRECGGEEALRRVDLALYEAKRRGRGRYALFEEGMTSRVARKAEIEVALRRAIDRGEISLAFQPQFTLPDRRLIGFEALARWEHPALGRVGPAEFVGIAEESGLIVDLSALTFRLGCSAAAAWHARGFRGRVSVNASPVLFRDDVHSMLGGTLAETGCPPGALEVEITESVLLTDSEPNRQMLEELRAAGVEIALDDFGMGYSSLGYLRNFPLDRIKIDRAFVTELGRSAQADSIVTAITELGHALGMEVTAEGVERAEQVTLLEQAGCDRVQGYYFGRPLSHEAATEAVLDSVIEDADKRPEAGRRLGRSA